jgi:hypothetical protein
MILYHLSMVCVKVSVIFFYLRIFPNRRFRIGTWGVLGLIMAWGVSCLFVIAFQCDPPAGIWNHWDSAIAGGSCLDVRKLAWGHTVSNLIFDIVVVLLPVPVLLQLQMSAAKKIQVILMFSVGLL